MHVQRSLVLPLVLAALLAGVWLCYRGLGNGVRERELFGLGDEVLAGAGSAAGLGEGARGESAFGPGSGSGRAEIAAEVVIDEEALAASAAEAELGGSRLTGTVVRGAGIPVAGARVVARRTQPWFSPPPDLEEMPSMSVEGPRFEAETDAEGRFVLHEVPAGKLAMSIRAAGLAPLLRSDLEIPEHEDYDLGRFQLELGIRLAGQVVGPRGKGVEGAQVLGAVSPEAGSTRLDLPGRGIPLTITDPEGRFEIDGLAPGSWHLIFDAPAYRVAEKKGSLEPAGNSDLALLVNLELGLAVEGRVLGLTPGDEGRLRVTARHDDEQPAGAADEVQGAERHRPRHGPVDVDGSFAVRGLSPGVQYKLRLYRQDPPQAEEGGDASPGRWKGVQGVEDVVAMAGARQVEFKYREQAVVLLQVQSAKSGSPLSRFHVEVRGDNLSGGGLLQDESGEPRLSHPGGVVRYEKLLPAETGSSLTVRVRAEGFEDFEKKDVLLRPGQELDLGLCALQPAPTGRVKVLDGATGEPISAARVIFSRAADAKNLERWAGLERPRPLTDANVRDALTNESGVAELSLWKGSICVLKAFAEGYQTGEEARHVPPFDKQVEVRLVRGGKITVRVVDAEGRPVPGMYVEHKIDDKRQDNQHFWDPDSGQENKTGEGGQVVFLNLPEGKHGFNVLEKQNAWGGGGESAGFEAEGDVYLKKGEARELELRVAARGGLSTTILESGLPLTGALVKLSPVEGGAGDNMWFWGGGQQDPRTKISDHGGRAAFSGIKVGRYNLRISHADRRMVVSREVLVQAEPDALVIDVGLAIIEGRVVDPEGAGVAGASISVYEQESGRRNHDMNDYRVRITEDEDGDAEWNVDQIKQWAIQTDDEGRFILRGVTPECELVVNASDNYIVTSARSAGPLGSDEYLSPFDFVVERAGVLRIDAPGIDRQVRGRMTVKLVRMEGDVEKEIQRTRLRSWRDNVDINSLRPGTWKLSLFQDNMPEPLLEREVSVQVRKTTRVTLEL